MSFGRKQISPKPIHLDIDFSANVVTSQTVSTLFSSILDLLLFQRKQIPFVYHTFKYMVDKFDAMEKNEDWENYLVDNERKLASKTLGNAKTLKRNVAAEMEATDMDRVLIMFGPNSLTPREAFEIHLPPVNRDHFGKNHIKSDNAAVRHVNMSILTSNEFVDSAACNHHTSNITTNIYVLLKPRCPNYCCSETTFQRHDDFQIHSDCLTTIIRLRNTHSSSPDFASDELTNCCRDLVVFKELGVMSISDKRTMSAPSNSLINTDPDAVAVADWFESDVVIAGYKDVPVKGKSIWL